MKLDDAQQKIKRDEASFEQLKSETQRLQKQMTSEEVSRKMNLLRDLADAKEEA